MESKYLHKKVKDAKRTKIIATGVLLATHMAANGQRNRKMISIATRKRQYHSSV